MRTLTVLSLILLIIGCNILTLSLNGLVNKNVKRCKITVFHTSNGLEHLKSYAGINYAGESHYINEPAVRDGSIVTANGFSALEFSRKILYALEAYALKKIEKSYRMNKTGVWEAPEVE